MVDSVQQNFCEKILIPSDFICMFKMSFFFLAHPVYMLCEILYSFIETYFLTNENTTKAPFCHANTHVISYVKMINA